MLRDDWDGRSAEAMNRYDNKGSKATKREIHSSYGSGAPVLTSAGACGSGPLPRPVDSRMGRRKSEDEGVQHL